MSIRKTRGEKNAHGREGTREEKDCEGSKRRERSQKKHEGSTKKVHGNHKKSTREVCI